MKKDAFINNYFTLVNFGKMPVYRRKLGGGCVNAESRQNDEAAVQNSV
jgi:hypothetical protein